MASNGNINRGTQLIVDVIDYKMLNGKYLTPYETTSLANATINSSVL